mmetsp:Transcript_13436/g.49978  ORF Transcript_13436/g.49978 Transcript_13436/m.49978 type:complete len:138 (-) Transcript_13436:1092-1505(-)|eukprot:scaffold1144_cov215-Pinguiococcus_pyrenoidosus.AAC.1
MAPGKHGRQPRSRQQELFGDPEVMKMGEAIADVVEDVIGPTLSDEVFVDGAEAVHATSGVLVEPFLQLHPPPCSVRHYLSRITKYSGLSEEALVCSAVSARQEAGRNARSSEEARRRKKIRQLDGDRAPGRSAAEQA